MPDNVKHQALDELVRIKLQLVELDAKATQLEAIILGDTAKPRSNYGTLGSRTDSKLSRRMVRKLPDGRWAMNDASQPEKSRPSSANVPAKRMSARLSAIQKQRYASAKANPLGLTDRQQACLDAVKSGAHNLSDVCRSVSGHSGATYSLLQGLIKRGLITKNRWQYAIKL